MCSKGKHIRARRQGYIGRGGGRAALTSSGYGLRSGCSRARSRPGGPGSGRRGYYVFPFSAESCFLLLRLCRSRFLPLLPPVVALSAKCSSCNWVWAEPAWRAVYGSWMTCCSCLSARTFVHAFCCPGCRWSHSQLFARATSSRTYCHSTISSSWIRGFLQRACAGFQQGSSPASELTLPGSGSLGSYTASWTQRPSPSYTRCRSAFGWAGWAASASSSRANSAAGTAKWTCPSPFSSSERSDCRASTGSCLHSASASPASGCRTSGRAHTYCLLRCSAPAPLLPTLPPPSAQSSGSAWSCHRTCCRRAAGTARAAAAGAMSGAGGRHCPPFPPQPSKTGSGCPCGCSWCAHWSTRWCLRWPFPRPPFYRLTAGSPGSCCPSFVPLRSGTSSTATERICQFFAEINSEEASASAIQSGSRTQTDSYCLTRSQFWWRWCSLHARWPRLSPAGPDRTLCADSVTGSVLCARISSSAFLSAPARWAGRGYPPSGGGAAIARTCPARPDCGVENSPRGYPGARLKNGGSLAGDGGTARSARCCSPCWWEYAVFCPSGFSGIC